MERRKKEILVKRVHKNKISEPSGSNKRYRTRVNDETVTYIAVSILFIIHNLQEYKKPCMET